MRRQEERRALLNQPIFSEENNDRAEKAVGAWRTQARDSLSLSLSLYIYIYKNRHHGPRRANTYRNQYPIHTQMFAVEQTPISRFLASIPVRPEAHGGSEG